MVTINADIYDYPKYYDLVFGSDWKAEHDFLLRCFSKHSRIDPTLRLFEPACGTGRLMYRLAQSGCEVAGIDLNPRAVQFCNRRLRRRSLPGKAWIADMVDFRVPSQYDAAFNTINSFRHLGSHANAVEHLHSVARALRPGGLYVLGIHLTPTVGSPSDEEAWSARRGNLCVNTRMWNTARDLTNRVERYEMSYDVYTPTKSFRLLGELVLRTYTVDEINQLFNEVCDFKVVETYDFSYSIDDPIRVTAETEDVVYVLRKR